MGLVCVRAGTYTGRQAHRRPIRQRHRHADGTTDRDMETDTDTYSTNMKVGDLKDRQIENYFNLRQVSEHMETFGIKQIMSTSCNFKTKSQL